MVFVPTFCDIKDMEMSKLSKEFTLRPATMGDLDAVVALFNACSVAQIGKAVIEETELGTDWKMPFFDMEADTQAVLASDDEIVGYTAVWDRAPHVRISAHVRVHPEYTGQRIGAYLGRWVEERALQAIPKAPSAARVVLEQNVYSTDAAARESLLRQGYRLVRYYFGMAIDMDGPPPEPVLPEGITIRHFRRDEEARALVHALRDAFEDHWGYVELPFEDEYATWLTAMDEDPAFDETLWFVAIADGEIAGFTQGYDICAEGPQVGAVEVLGVRRQWRRRGIALALLRHSFRELYCRGRTTVTLNVDAQSLTGALRLYEKAGMHVQYRIDRYEKELRPGEDMSTRELED
jgi:mycothiol synthase